jgi:hypothetical protein
MKLLLFIATMGGLLSLVPLITWAVTGRRDRAWQAARQYWLILGSMVLLGSAAAALVLLPMLWS